MARAILFQTPLRFAILCLSAQFRRLWPNQQSQNLAIHTHQKLLYIKHLIGFPSFWQIACNQFVKTRRFFYSNSFFASVLNFYVFNFSSFHFHFQGPAQCCLSGLHRLPAWPINQDIHASEVKVKNFLKKINPTSHQASTALLTAPLSTGLYIYPLRGYYIYKHPAVETPIYFTASIKKNYGKLMETLFKQKPAF